MSKHWNEALFEMTGEREISASAILEYFKPLSDFLDRENAIKQRLMDYKDDAISECNSLQLAEWASAVDVGNKEKEALRGEAVLKYAEFAKATYERFKDIKVDEIGDELSRRQVNSLQTLDTDILSVAQLTEVYIYQKLISKHLFDLFFYFSFKLLNHPWRILTTQLEFARMIIKIVTKPTQLNTLFWIQV